MEKIYRTMDNNLNEISCLQSGQCSVKKTISGPGCPNAFNSPNVTINIELTISSLQDFGTVTENGIIISNITTIHHHNLLMLIHS